MLGNFINFLKQWFENFATTWGNNQLVSGLILLLIGGLFGVIFKTLLPQLWKQLVRFISLSRARLSGQESDHHFEQAYLDWLIRVNQPLGQLPTQFVKHQQIDQDKFVGLENVFIKLTLTPLIGHERWTETSRYDKNSWRKQPLIELYFARFLRLAFFGRTSISSEDTYKPGDPGLLVDRHQQLVICGNPGSGKTTLLKYLTLTCARALLNNKSRDLVKKRLLWTQRPFPILVKLGHYRHVENWDEALELTDMMLQELDPLLRKQCPQGFFERHLRKGNCLVLFDAFDELGYAETQAAIARKMVGFLAIYNRANHIVVTTRITGDEDQLADYGFALRQIQELQAGEIRALVKQRYAALASSEKVTLDPQSSDTRLKMLESAERLIQQIENIPQLQELATNPMLLSLIVLIHSRKGKLREERHRLYEECINILIESWEQSKRKEAGLKKEERVKLAYNQKLVLLCELAYEMQLQRKDESRETLMPKVEAQNLIAQKLPDFLGETLPQEDSEKRNICREKAKEWMAGIQTESGILVEQDFDEDGEPLVTFAHRTFQEYLAAVSINKDSTRLKPLLQNLLQPAWQEVILLYVAMADDATPIIHDLLNSPSQPDGLLLAGRCQAERRRREDDRREDDQMQQVVLERLKEGFSNTYDETISDFGKVMGMLGGREIISFMRQQLSNPSLKHRLAAISALGQTKPETLELEQVRDDLVQVVESPHEPKIMVAAREALAQVGDPRFIGPEPTLVRVDKQPAKVPALLREWGDLKTSPEWKSAKNFSRRFGILARVLDYWLFSWWHAIWQQQSPNDTFEIGKYPVTNIEYRRFVEDKGHRTPKSWKEGLYPREEATHPIVGITKIDAEAYCKWLSDTTRSKYRLPAEWEWAWAAAGPDGRKYPWGDLFEKDKCNIAESGIEGMTPVGSYITGNSANGASDMSGNVWEITSGVLGTLVVAITSGAMIAFFALLRAVATPAVSDIPYFLFVSALSIVSAIIGSLIVYPISVSIITSAARSKLAEVVFVVLVMASILAAIQSLSLPGVLGPMLASALFGGFTAIFLSVRLSVPGVLRGGAWNTPSDKATCFDRDEIVVDSMLIGFRCLKEI